MRLGGDHDLISFRLARQACVVAVAALSTMIASAQPANDHFADRAVIAGQSAITASLSNATSEVGEPLIPDVSSGQTAWWTWTAPANGILTLSASGNGFRPLLQVYTGTELASLSLIASNNYLACYESADCGCHWRVRDQTTFHVAAGQEYQIAVDSAILVDASWIRTPPPVPTPENPNPLPFLYPRTWTAVQTTNVLPGGDLQLGIQFTPAPLNDDFEQRAVLGTGFRRLEVNVSNAGATKQPGEPDHLGNPGGSSVWFSWTAPESGRLTLSTNSLPPYSPPSWSGGWSGFSMSVAYMPVDLPPSCGNEIDQNPPPVYYPVFAAYTGNTLDSLAPANCLPLSLSAFPHAITFDAIKGQTYQIALDGNRGTTGNLNLCLALTTPAANDDFNNRIKLHGINVVATGYNAGATQEPGEPSPPTGASGKSVWWSWTPPASGTVSIDLGGSDYPSMSVAVFTGSDLAGLQLLASGSGSVSFEGVVGQIYQIAVYDHEGLTGSIRMSVRGPMVELPLARQIRRSSNRALLRYTSSPGQVILLQKCTDGWNWTDVKIVLARKKPVEFLVRPAPQPYGTAYRAIIVDRISH